MRVFTRFLSIFLKEIDVLKAKTLKIFASGGSFLKEKKLTKSRYLNLKKEQNKGGGGIQKIGRASGRERVKMRVGAGT